MAAPAGRVCRTQASLQSIDSLVHMRQVSFPRHVCEPARDLIRNLLQSMCACVLSSPLALWFADLLCSLSTLCGWTAPTSHQLIQASATAGSRCATMPGSKASTGVL